jgi:hypothetical protein
MSNGAVLTALITLVVAVTGYAATYFNNLRIDQRNARLIRVNRQLNELYGPLLAIRRATQETWYRFVEKHELVYQDKDKFFFNGSPATERELETWRTWVETVFMPGNRRTYELILSKGDLLIDDDMPIVMMDFCAHVLGYEVVIAQWRVGNFSEHTSIVHYPPKFDNYVQRSFRLLKQEQARLLGRQGSVVLS